MLSELMSTGRKVTVADVLRGERGQFTSTWARSTQVVRGTPDPELPVRHQCIAETCAVVGIVADTSTVDVALAP
jgi:hypothetical protein